MQVLTREGELVGHIAHVPFGVFVGGEKRCLGHGGDVMVRHDSRGPEGLPKLLRGFLSSNHGFDLRINFPVPRAGAAMERLGGGRRLGTIPHWQCAVGDARRPRWPKRLSPLRVGPLDRLGPEVDTLARASRRFAPCIRIRDAAYLRWRWLAQPDGDWTMRAARNWRGSLVGLAVIGYRGDRAGGRGLVGDLLAQTPGALQALLLDAVDELAAVGCRRVECDCLDPRPWSPETFARAGFRREGGDEEIGIICRPLSSRAGPLPELRDSWYLTRGDTDIA